MKFINLAYDYEYDDNVLIDMGKVDILIVPDFVSENLDEIVQKFFIWTDEVRKVEKSKYPEYWMKLPNGDIGMCVNSNHFVEWLNKNYFQCENENSTIVKIGTTYNPNYPTAKF